MKKSYLSFSLALLLSTVTASSHAGPRATLRSPAAGVLCDRYFCADAEGISKQLTTAYLGQKAAAKLFAQGDFVLTEFTFANGIFCDVKEQLCREDRYFSKDGKRNGAISKKYTDLLFKK